MVAALAKNDTEIRASLLPGDCDLLHMAVGTSTESGELLDAVKKYVFYRKPIDRENVIEELGDMEFYMEGLRGRLGITRNETIEHNIAKLSIRYPGFKYSNKRANERKDKAV